MSFRTYLLNTNLDVLISTIFMKMFYFIFKGIPVIVCCPSKQTLYPFKKKNHGAQWKSICWEQGDSESTDNTDSVRAVLNHLKYSSIMALCYTVQERLCFKLAMSVLQSRHAHMSTWILLVPCAVRPNSALTLSDRLLHLPNRGVELYMHNRWVDKHG